MFRAACGVPPACGAERPDCTHTALGSALVHPYSCPPLINPGGAGPRTPAAHASSLISLSGTTTDEGIANIVVSTHDRDHNISAGSRSTSVVGPPRVIPDEDGSVVSRAEWAVALAAFTEIFDLAEARGYGRSAVVYRAVHRASGAVFAAKVYHTALSPKRVRAVHREGNLFVGRCCDTLSHSAVVYGSCFPPHLPAVVMMEYVAGEHLQPLWTRLSAHNDWPGLHDLARQLVCGVSQLHRAGIAHRDIKSENILVTLRTDRTHCYSNMGRHGAQADLVCAGTYHLKLVDFGAAVAEWGDCRSSFPHRGGTPLYMSPAALAEEQKTRPAFTMALLMRSDIWAVAVTLHLALYDYYPYNAVQLKALSRVHALRQRYVSQLPHVPQSSLSKIYALVETVLSEHVVECDDLLAETKTWTEAVRAE